MVQRAARLDLAVGALRLAERAWRSLATQFCFAVFMVSSLLALPFAVPLAYLTGSTPKRHRAGKALTRGFFRLFTQLMRRIGVLDLDIRGGELLRGRGLVIVANHPTLIDFVVLAGLVPRADCLVKSSLRDHWAMRWPVRLAGYIPNDRGEETLELCRLSLAAGNSIVIFPEGTRTPPGAPARFRRGAAQVAVRCGKAVTPVAIACPASNLHKGGPWYLAPPVKPRMRLEVLEPLETGPLLELHGGQATPAARALTTLLEQRINEVLEREGLETA